MTEFQYRLFSYPPLVQVDSLADWLAPVEDRTPKELAERGPKADTSVDFRYERFREWPKVAEYGVPMAASKGSATRENKQPLLKISHQKGGGKGKGKGTKKGKGC